MTLLAAVLFFLLTPGLFFNVPKGVSIYYVAAGHALLFGLAYYLLKLVLLKIMKEGFFGEPVEGFLVRTKLAKSLEKHKGCKCYCEDDEVAERAEEEKGSQDGIIGSDTSDIIANEEKLRAVSKTREASNWATSAKNAAFWN